MSAPPLHVGLLVSDLSHRHGWATYSLSLIRALQAAGVRLTIVSARNTQPIDGIDTLPLLPALEPRERRFMLRLALALPAVRSALRDCTVIHAAVEPYAPLAALIAGKRPLVITGHGSYVRVYDAWQPPVSHVYAWAYRRALMVCVSQYTARTVEATLPGVRTVVVNNGVDASRFEHLPPLDTPKRGMTILSVGAVKPRKGTLELVRAIPAMRREIPDVQCVVIGSLTLEPDYAEQVRREIESLDLTDCIHLLGYVPEQTMMAWYGAADIFVLSSLNDGWKFEGFGLSLLEASAAGLPVIGTTDCGGEDAVDDGVTGLLVPQAGLADALPDAILSLLRDARLRECMGAAGREKARLHTWNGVARRMVGIYGEEAGLSAED